MVTGVRARPLAHLLVPSSPTWLFPCCLRIVSPLKNTRATTNRTISSLPLSVTVRFFSVLLVPLSTLKAVSRNESLHDEHVAIEVALPRRRSCSARDTNLRTRESVGAVVPVERLCLDIGVSFETPGGPSGASVGQQLPLVGGLICARHALAPCLSGPVAVTRDGG